MEKDTHVLEDLVRDYQDVGPPSQSSLFHLALQTKDAAAMHRLSMQPQADPDSVPFLAPTSELRSLARLYGALLTDSPGLRQEYESLLARATELSRALRLPNQAENPQSEAPGDRERVALAWLFFHLAAVRNAQGDQPELAPQDHISAALALVSRSCQPRTWQFFHSVGRDEHPCSTATSPFSREEYLYLCSLADMIVEDPDAR